MATQRDYWQRRTEQRLVNAEKTGRSAIVQVLDVYEQSLNNIDKEIQSIYRNYSKEGVLSTSELQKALTKTELKDFMRKVEVKAQKMGLDPRKIYDERYVSRLNRLQALREQISLEVQSMSPREEEIQSKAYKKILEDGYAATQKDLSSQGINPTFDRLDSDIVDSIMKSVWAKSNYSNRIWGNNNKLAMRLPTILGGALAVGQSYEKTARQLRENYNVKRYEAVRLIRTETTYMYNQAEAQSFVDDGIERYTLDVTLDGRTSNICLDIDESEVFEVSNISVGLNYPPLHPQCRTVPRALLDGEEAPKPVTDKDERIDRYQAFDDGSVKDKLKEAMQKQMNPDKPIHDYNAEMNQITQDLSNKIINRDQFQEKLNDLMSRIPEEDPLKPALENVARLQGWKQGASEIKETLTESQKKTRSTVKKKFDEVGWDFKEAKLDQNQIEFIEKSNLKLDSTGAEVSILNQGQYDSLNNSLSIADERLKTTRRVTGESKLYENVVKHELGHAVDYFAPFMDDKVGDLFSQSIDFRKAIAGKGGDSTISEFSNEALSIFKHRVAQGMTDKNVKLAVRNTNVDDFRTQMDTYQAVKVGRSYTEVPFDTMTYMLSPKELFAESYALYYTDPKYLKSEAPKLYNYIDRVSKLKIS